MSRGLSSLKSEWFTFLCAVQFLTRIPINSDIDYNEQRLNQAVGYYPLVGVLIGTILFIVFLIGATLLTNTLAVLLSMVFGLMLTGAFHEDGFADMCDGIGGGVTKERSLEIMRDSRLGTYGVCGLTSILSIKAAVLIAIADFASTETLFLIFILSHGLSRASAVVVLGTSQYVRAQGAAKPVASGLDRRAGTAAGATALTLLALFTLTTSVLTTLYSLAFLALGHIAVRRVFEKKLGGYTGDCLGAVQQVSEVTFLLGFCAWLYSF
jgi:adenosylcobinamide-GDP ribazoletransferase